MGRPFLMTADRWARVEDLFDRAADLPRADRAAFLDAACRDADGTPDRALREEVDRMLALDTGADGFFHDLTGGGLGVPDDPMAGVPERVGPWRLVREVGKGGMGTVYLAERDDGTFAQRAAIKLVRPGLADDLVARFRAERHLLARLEHPGIARVLDGGTAPDGRPYLALEYVDGEPITAFADRRQLSVNERLALFQDVCDAVAYAHRRLVVHRDLKPSNVLVAQGEDGVRQVKLLDFGIAKLLDDDADFTVALTAPERRILTPAYAAPEQIRGDAATTATDVYGLGVLLYELLTGQRPYQIDRRVREAIERAVLDADPTEPSTIVTTGADAAALASARGTEPRRLRKRLQGDLDRIVLMALRKEPDRRYGSAEAFSADLRRHLDGLPVEARPASVGYRVGAFVRRHRVGVGIAAGLAVLLVAYAATVTTQARRIAAERDRAEAVTDLLVGLFDGGDPDVARGDTLTALALLDSAAVRLGVSMGEEPALRSRLQVALGRIYTQQGAFARADSLLGPALAQARADGDPGALADALYQAAEVRYWVGDYAEAEALHREGLELAERIGRPAREIAERTNRVGIARARQGDYADARRTYQTALALLRDAGPPTDPEIGRTLANLGVLDYYEGRFAESEARYRQALAILTPALGSGHPEVIMNRREMAWPIGDQGRAEEAVGILTEVDRANRRLYGEGHPTVGNTLGELSRYQRAAGDLDGAEASAREGLRLQRALYGDDHAYVANKMLDVALVLRERGDLSEARRLADGALAIQRATLGADHPYTAAGHGHVAHIAALQGDRAAALRHEREALRLFEAAYGPGHPRTDTSRARLARLTSTR